MTMKIASLLAAVLITGMADAAQMGEKDKERFLNVLGQSCLEKQKRDSLTSNTFSEPQLKEYCGCTGKLLLDSLSNADIDKANRERTLDHIKTNIDAAGRYCATTLSNKWGQQKPSNDAEYISLFNKNVVLLCYRDYTSGSDGIPPHIAKPICQCYGDTIAKTFTIKEMKDSDVNPNRYASRVEKIMTDCVKKTVK